MSNERLREILTNVHRRPGMFFMRPTFDTACAFLSGIDLLLAEGEAGRGFSGDFQTFMLKRVGGPRNWGCWSYVPPAMGLTIGDPVPEERQQEAIDTLFTLMDGFLACSDVSYLSPDLSSHSHGTGKERPDSGEGDISNLLQDLLERGLRDATFLSEWLEAGEVAPIDSDFRRAAVGGILTKALLTGLIEPVWIEDEVPIHLLDKQRWISLILDRIDGDFLGPGLGAMLRTTEAGAAVLAISYGTGDLIDAVAIDPRAVIASIGDSTISQISFRGMPFGHMSIQLDGEVAVQIYSQITLHSADGSSGRLETDNPDDATRLLAAMYLQKAHLSLGPEGEFSVQIANGAQLSVARSTEGTAWEIIWINGTSVVCDEGGHIRMEPGNPLKLRSAH